jgi:fermentation-respiration switch protein FrsA (DUF1100 family)
MGTGTMEHALERAQAFTLAEALPHLTQPFLIVHGADDSMIPLSHAERAIEAAGSSDKQLVVFDGVDGGAEHCSMDDSDPARGQAPEGEATMAAAQRLFDRIFDGDPLLAA